MRKTSPMLRQNLIEKRNYGSGTVKAETPANDKTSSVN
jgi:hypothetical protein